MAYSNTIPAANDLLSQSQQDLLDNFVSIQTLIEVNHEAFGAADEGKHKFVSMPEQGADPATTADEIAIYTKQSAVSGNAELFLRNENNGSVVEFSVSIKANPGYTILPSGVIFAWGSGTINVGNANSAAINFHTAFPAAILSVQMTPFNQQTGAAQDYVINSFNRLVGSFQANRNNSFIGTTASFYYLAIGY